MKLIKASQKGTIGKLEDIIQLHVHITSNNQSGMASLNNDWMHLEDQLDYYLRLRSNYEDDFREIIQVGIDRGELKNGNLFVCTDIENLPVCLGLHGRGIDARHGVFHARWDR